MMGKTMKIAGLLLCCLLIAACVGDRNIRSEFERSVKKYNSMLRWREMENAGLIYMEDDLREAFVKDSEALRKRGITITDYRILISQLYPEKGTGNAVVEFDYFALPSNRVKTLTYKQDWVYREIGQSRYFKDMIWKLKTGLPAFE